ncbi:MAG TPA: putative sulfate exporter family transporter [Gemmatales bacterium]|nr:putative sulfate exporter family transporter [Gemmatales bacterium]HMP16194.1 putative sulfate exporter family transporter [Gemmatales bacterium]
MIQVWRSYLPGWALMVLLSLCALFISQLVVVGNSHPLEASALVVVLGIILRNSWQLPSYFYPGIKAAEKLLVLGIVLMGFGLNYQKVFAESTDILTLILVTMLVGFCSILVLSHWARLSSKLGILLSCGTCICGGTAIALVAPLIKAKEEETSYSVAVIALWGVVAVLLYPALGTWLGVSSHEFGLFAGTAIHSTPQVVGAGFIFSEDAGKLATAVKLVRNCFMAPMALLIALWFARSATVGEASGTRLLKAFPWFLFGYFLTSWLGTQGYVSRETYKDYLEPSGKFLILLGMAGVGLNTDLISLRRVGWMPLIIGMIGAIIVAAVAAGIIIWLR